MWVYYILIKLKNHSWILYKEKDLMQSVIKVENLSKEYNLGVIGHGTLYRDLQSWWAKIRGLEDPNSIIGHEALSGKDRFLALNNINIDIKEGEVLGIIGPNGAGKSTLLKILSRITTPSKGKIKIKGKVSSLLEVGTGFHYELTGRENIFLNGAINGMSKKEVTSKLDEIVDFAGVNTYLDTPVKRYSSGMFVRLGFAVAAFLNPDIFIVDEVLAVGDADFQNKAINKMEDISKSSGRTVLFVSHNMDSIRRFCSKTLLLENGKVKKVGETNEVISSYLNDLDYKISNSGQINFETNGNKKFQVLSYCLIDKANKKTGILKRKDNFKINIEYLVKEKVEDLVVDITISTYGQSNGVSHDTAVLQWSEQHNNNYKFKDERVVKDIGKYSAEINIPGNFLNEGKYSLSVNLALAGNWYEKNENIIFELFDSDSTARLKTGKTAGLLSMKLDWEEKKINE